MVGSTWRAVAVVGLGALGVLGIPRATSPTTAPSTRVEGARTAAVRSAAEACPGGDATWPLSKRLAQLLMVEGTYSDLSADTQEASGGAGGLVLLGQPAAGTGDSIASGLAALQAAAARAGQEPLWMSTDEEGGPVQRLSSVVGSLPAPRQMAATETPAQVRAGVAVVAAQMRRLGITMDLAPVLDTAAPSDTVAEEGQRSFSEDGSTAAAYGLAFADGLLDGGVTPVVKHFPGLGHASANTDDGPATDPPLSSLEGHDLVPFAAAAGADLPVVMVGHPVVPGLTGGLPASLSAATYTYLHDTLGFNGLTMTDALAAGAVAAAGYDQPRATVTAIGAGADMALIQPSAWSATLQALTTAVDSGALPLSRVDQAVDRVLAAKGAAQCRTVGIAAGALGGFWTADGAGAVTGGGGATPVGSAAGVALNRPLVGMAATPDGHGYWLVASDGGIFTYGDANFYGSGASLALDSPVVGMARVADGGGYWLVTARGAVAGLGDAAP